MIFPTEECLLDMERERVMPAFETLWKNLATEVEQGWACWQLSQLFCSFRFLQHPFRW